MDFFFSGAVACEYLLVLVLCSKWAEIFENLIDSCFLRD